MSFKRSLVKFATVLSVFFTGISFINVPLQTQTVQAASQSKTEKRNAVVQLAKEQVGKSYVYGATGPSAFDCSGLAQKRLLKRHYLEPPMVKLLKVNAYH